MENSVQVSAKLTNSGHEACQVFPSKSSIEPRAHSGIRLMETKTIFSKLETTEDKNTKTDNSKEYFRSRLGGSLLGSLSKGNLVISR